MNYELNETTANDIAEMITHFKQLSLEERDLLIAFMDVISDRSLQKVEEEAGDIISSASPEEILFCDNIYSRVEKTDFDPETHEMLHVLAATICNRMLDPTMPLNHWLLGAITAAAQAGYVVGRAERSKMKPLYSAFEEVKETLDILQATECHVVNIHDRDVTEYEADGWEDAVHNYKSALIQAIATLFDELANLEGEKNDRERRKE